MCVSGWRRQIVRLGEKAKIVEAMFKVTFLIAEVSISHIITEDLLKSDSK